MNRQLIVADSACLMANGEAVMLHIGALAYAPADIIPAGLLVKHELLGGATAAYFVSQVMTRRFGAGREQWPALAVAFLTSADGAGGTA